MGHAKQQRRMAKKWALCLGLMAGRNAATDFAMGDYGEGRTVEELRETLEDWHPTWDSPARSAATHVYDRCPKGHEETYYAAYERSARQSIEELT